MYMDLWLKVVLIIVSINLLGPKIDEKLAKCNKKKAKSTEAPEFAI